MAEKRKRHIDRRMESMRQARNKRNRRVAIIIMQLFIISMLSVATYGLFKYSKFDVDVIDKTEIVVNEGVFKEGYTTIALFGGDSRTGNLGAGSHADSIMIASVDNVTKEVNIASVYRDTLTLQTNGSFAKVNNAYYVGGATGAISVLNMNFDVDIMNYVTVDFIALTKVIDLLGGVELEVSEAEKDAINDYVGETSKVSGVTSSKITTTGLQLLDGAQAVTYARIRKNVGEDYARTQRQRALLKALLEKVNIFDFKTINSLIDTVFEQVSTSFTIYELLELAAAVSKYQIIESTGFPIEFSELNLTGIGSVIAPTTHLVNVEKLHEILYPNEVYEPSSKVVQIDEYISGNLAVE